MGYAPETSEGRPSNTVAITAEPEEVAVPVQLPNVAAVGALVNCVPTLVIVNGVPPAIAPPVTGTVAVAPLPPPPVITKLHVPAPESEPPEVYVPMPRWNFAGST